MAPKYVLNYFDAEGRIEAVRVMFHVAGVEFTDFRMVKDQWANNKPDVKRFPLSQLPTLEVDGKVICQSQAIFRFVAREVGLYGDNSYEQALIDQVTETLTEISNDVIPIHFGGHDEETKKTKFAEFFASEKLKQRFSFVSNILQSNNGGSGFLVGNKMSLADAAFYGNSFFLTPVNSDYLDAYPELKALMGRIKSNDNIKKYLESKKK